MPAEQPNICDDLQPWLAAYALGDAEEGAAPARAHLAVCPRCQRALREYRMVAGMLPFSAPEAMPKPELREQVIAAVKRQVADSLHTSVPSPALPATPLASARRPSQRRWFWAALAFAVLALALLGWNISLRRDLDRQTALVVQSRKDWQTMIVLLDDEALAKYAIAADVAPPAGQAAARGDFLASPQAQVACLVAQGLPELQAGQVYQVWLVRGDQQSSGGTFEVHNGNTWAFVQGSQPITSYDAMFVTVEPTGGNTWPAGPRVMSGTLSGATTAGLADRQELLGLLRRED